MLLSLRNYWAVVVVLSPKNYSAIEMLVARRATTILKWAIAFGSKFVFHKPQLGLVSNAVFPKNYCAGKMILSPKSYSAIVSNAFVPKNYCAGKMILSPKSYSAIVSNAFVPEKLLR